MAEIITGENIEKLRELAHEDTVNECVEWLIKHYEMVGEEVVKLGETIEEYARTNGELTNASGRIWISNVELKKENEELKAKLEYEKELYANCRTLYTELEGENEELKRDIKVLEFTNFENKKLKNENANLTTANEYINFWDNEKQNSIDKLKEENEELKARVVDLEESEKQSIETMKILGINCIGDLVKQNEELKKENYELRVDLAKSNRVADEWRGMVVAKGLEIDELKKEIENANGRALHESQQRALMSADWASLDNRNNALSGKLDQANKTIKDLIESILKH